MAVKPDGIGSPEPLVTSPEMVTSPVAGGVVWSSVCVALICWFSGVAEPSGVSVVIAVVFVGATMVEVGVAVFCGAAVISAPGGGVISSDREKLQALRIRIKKMETRDFLNFILIPGNGVVVLQGFAARRAKTIGDFYRFSAMRTKLGWCGFSFVSSPCDHLFNIVRFTSMMF